MDVIIAFIKGTAPGKWFDRYTEWTDNTLDTYEAVDSWSKLETGQCDMAFVRLPDARIDTDNFHCVRLYDEAWGIAMNKDSELSLLEKVRPSDIAEEIINYDGYKVTDTLDAMQIVAANVGVCIAPRPLLRAINNKECEHRDFIDDREPTSIALMWAKDKDCDAYQDFVGITKGRTKQTSRDSGEKKKAKKPAAKKAPAKKTTQSKPGAKAQRSGARPGGGARKGRPTKRRK
ncbi:MAG: LysR family transcriptional regulator substrate-binding protein [Corynebacterium sp.]|nr:LysR family transcriptional regulator substrate-binding protein [Corynebacterium sp.]